MKYKAILLDIDNTILNFDKAERYAIIKTFTELGINVTEEEIKRYHEVDLKWWKKFEAHEVSKEDLLRNRFIEFFEPYHITFDVDKLNKDYLYALGDNIYYMDNAVEFVNKLSESYKIYIITNGVYKTQTRRLSKTVFKDKFTKVYISETLGLKKPDKEYFDYVLNVAGLKNTEALIVGDSLSSDIQGGINSGIDTCWYNPDKKNSLVKANYEIHDLLELFDILKK